MIDIEVVVSQVLDTSFAIHSDLGPGLLENVYEQVLANRLSRQGLKIDRQMPVGANIDGLDFPEAFRLDLLVERRLVVEVKAVEKIIPVHSRQTLTYLRLMKLPLGLLINFGGITLKEGVKRIANNYRRDKI